MPLLESKSNQHLISCPRKVVVIRTGSELKSPPWGSQTESKLFQALIMAIGARYGVSEVVHVCVLGPEVQVTATQYSRRHTVCYRSIHFERQPNRLLQ